MKTYRYTIDVAHTNYHEEKRTNSLKTAIAALKRGYFVRDEEKDEELLLSE